jgi:hypothetical protein
MRLVDDHERAIRGDCDEPDQLRPATGIVRALGLALLIWLLIALAILSAGAGLEAEDFTDSGLGCVDCLDPAEPMPIEP